MPEAFSLSNNIKKISGYSSLMCYNNTLVLFLKSDALWKKKIPFFIRMYRI